MSNDLNGKVALVAGGTRGASRAIAVELARSGAFVYVTGRSSGGNRSPVDRPETIEGTVDAITAAGGEGTAVRVDHLEPDQVKALAERVAEERGRLDILVTGVWGGDRHMRWNTPVWEHPLDASLSMLHLAIDAHVITAHHLLPLVLRSPAGLVVELTDGTPEYDAKYRKGTTLAYYLAKVSAHPLARAEAAELADHGATAISLTPGWLRSEAMLDTAFGVTEENWQDGTAKSPHFAISESPTYIGRGLAALAADPDRSQYSGQSLTSADLAKRYGVTDTDGSRPDAWRYIAEVVDQGLPADTTGYR